MYLLTSLTILSLVFSGFSQTIKHPACPDSGFKYVYLNEKHEWVGLGWAWTSYENTLNNIKLHVEFATAELPDTTNLGTIKVLNFYPVKNPDAKKEWTIVYEVKFPIQDPLPNVTKIVWNDQIICYDPLNAFTEEKPHLVKMKLKYNDYLEEQAFTTELLTKPDPETENYNKEDADSAVGANSGSNKFKTYLHPACPDSGLKFVHINQNEWIGVGWAWTKEESRFNNLVLEIELASPALENTTDLGSLKVLNFYPVRNPKNESTWNIVYEVRFATQDPLPDVTKIVWNDQTICYDPKKVFTAEKPIMIKMRAKYNNMLEEQSFSSELVTKSNYTTTYPTIHYNVNNGKDEHKYWIPDRFNHPACTDDGVKFIYVNKEVGWVAIGWAWTSETYRFHDLTLEVDFASALIPNTTYLGSLKVLTFYRVKNVEDARREWNVAYEIRFPIQDPIPDITKIVWNDETLCYDPYSVYTPQKPYLVKMRLRYNDYLEEQTFSTELVTKPFFLTNSTTPKSKLEDEKIDKHDIDSLLDEEHTVDATINEVTPALSDLESTTIKINQNKTE
ncbi:uncharacterized protein LOC129797007 isoform X1 [Lutzomyia longipalpis]|uniref:uncharacterized protein LOC129797007 isoform X1 n=1 Tax=Lutzomyia longipalpis TaxID=7200 RepID=UPI002483A226|nr:uncharacterized protein LOC129797007 isoform X1 [Lutzomyia longipalpis]